MVVMAEIVKEREVYTAEVLASRRDLGDFSS